MLNTRAPWALLLLLGSTSLLVACGSSSDDSSQAPGSGGGSTVNLDTFSGRVNGPGGVGLPAATVRFEGREVLTDANGSFLMAMVGALPTGSYLVEIDGATSTATGTYPLLDVMVDVRAGDTDITLPQVITLPNLDSPDAANQSVAVDGNGATMVPIDLDGPAGDIQLDGPMGTLITLGGQVPSVGVDINVTPVPPTEVPMPLREDLLGASFVTIQPGNGAFMTPAGGGLDVTLPNDLGLPVGAEVDIWSFDHDEADWVNRSDETGNRGTVVDLGGGLTGVQAPGVITEGGWHTPATPIEPSWATEVSGQVVDGMGNPLANVSVFTNLGQFGMTGADGTFSIPLVPAYDLASVDCVPVGFDLNLAAPPLLGSVTGDQVMVPAGDVMSGDVTDVGVITLDVPNTGCVSGIVNGVLAVAGDQVTITGPTSLMLPLSPGGTFSSCGLEPGSYTASIQFAGNPAPTSADFVINTGEVTTVVLQSMKGGGDDDLTVRVVFKGLGSAPGGDPVEGAQVYLRGSDPGSAGGLLMITDANGQATFQEVSGPFEITAWNETVIPGPLGDNVVRDATTVVDLSPTGDTVVLALFFGLGGPDLVADAVLRGSILNAPVGCPLTVTVSGETDPANPTLGFFASATNVQQSYELDVVSDEELDMFVTLDCATGNTAVSSAGILRSIPALTSGEERQLDIDTTSPEFAPFDQAVPVAIAGEGTAATVLRSGTFEVFDAQDPFSASANLFSTDQPAPGIWDLPAFSSGPFAGLDKSLSYFVTGTNPLLNTSWSQSATLDFMSLPTSVDIALLGTPELISPPHPVQVESAANLRLNFGPPATPAGLSGLFEQALLTGFIPVDPTMPQLGGVFVAWSFFQRENTTNVNVPPIADQIMGDGEYALNFSSTRFSGTPPDYDETFTNGGILCLTPDEVTFFDRFLSSSSTYRLVQMSMP